MAKRDIIGLEKGLWYSYYKMEKKYTNGEIDKAGKNLSKYEIEDSLIKDSVKIISEWRDGHLFGLEKLVLLVGEREQQVGGHNIVVSRLKKLESIKLKLTLSPTTSLSRMQDIGGCRIIVENMSRLNAIVSRMKKFHKGFSFIKVSDYISDPKSTGYRGYHIVYRFNNKNANDYRILLELQARTSLQHSWATAVETVGYFTKNSLKSNQGDDFWKKFFLLVSYLFEYEETGKITHYKNNINYLVNEIISHNKKYNCISKIAGYKASNSIIGEHTKSEEYFLLVLEVVQHQIKVYGYAKENVDLAQQQYIKIESQNNPNINSVLVSADTIEELRLGYSNYFVNTEYFIKQYNFLIRKYSKN